MLYSMSNKKTKHSNLKVSSDKKNNRAKIVFLLVVLSVLTFIAFSPSLKNEFTNWDDPTYVLENNSIKKCTSESLAALFSSTVSLNYHPLTIASLAFDYKLSELNPKTYHTSNLIFHLLNTLLVFYFIFLLSNGKLDVSLIVAVIFGIHPLHVESVAWISERKDVLYTFFFISALIAYYKYIQSVNNKILLYLLVILLYALSLFSKAVAVVLPVVMLLVDYYSNRKISKIIFWEKIPFFILSIVFGIVAFHVQSKGAIAAFEIFTIWQRITFAAYGMLNYIVQFFYPHALSTFYPYPNLVVDRLPMIFYISPFVVIVLCFLIYKSIKNSKLYIFGFLFFFVTIALVLQFISVGQVIMADRYSYVPYIGISFIIAMRYNWLQNHGNPKYSIYKKTAFISIVAFIGTLTYITFERCKVWKNSDTLWTDVISNYPQVDMAYKNRGNYYAEKTLYEKALSDFNNCIALNKNDAKVYSNRGNIFGLQGKFDLALADYSTSIKIESKGNVEAYLNRAITYSMMKEYANSLDDYTRAIAIDPSSLKIYQNRAYTYLGSGNYQKSIEDYNYVLSYVPTDVGAYFYRAYDYFQLKNYAEAIKDNTRAVELNPGYAAAYFNRSVSLKSIGNFKSALQDALKARELGNKIDDSYIDELRRKL